MSITRTYTIGGRDYRECGWLGCQIKSQEFRKPPAGTVREIGGELFSVFITRRSGLFRWEVSWCLVGLGGLSIDDANKRIRGFISRLRNDSILTARVNSNSDDVSNTAQPDLDKQDVE